MNSTITEIMTFVKENDVKFVRLYFCDLLGKQKCVAIMADRLEAAFSEGIGFDAYAIKGFGEVEKSDLLLFPDPTTLAVLPWRPGTGRVARFFCNIQKPCGAAFEGDGRAILKRIIDQYAKRKLKCKVGAECEFYLFETNERGEPTSIPLDNGGYLDVSPLDKGSDIRREICLTLEEMGIKPESSRHEQGPGQNEIDFRFDEPLAAADNLNTFKTVVMEIAARHGLYASFGPKPIDNAPGNGLHLNLSIEKSGRNIFEDFPCKISGSFAAGILDSIPQITAFCNPLEESYKRLGEFEAPKYVSWSKQNRSQLIRVPYAVGQRARIELRSPDPMANPYFAFALVLAAGLEGIDNELSLPPAVDVNLYKAGRSFTQGLTALPDTLSNAIILAKKSKLIESVLGKDISSNYLSLLQ